VSPEFSGKLGDLVGACAGASSIDGVCRAVLSHVVSECGYRRAVVFGVLGNRAEGATEGLTEGELQAFLDAVARAAVPAVVGTAFHGPRPSVELRKQMPSLEAPLLIGFDSVDPDCAGGVVVDSAATDDRIHGLRAIARALGPLVMKSIEIEHLRAGVTSLEERLRRANLVLDSLPDPVLVMDQESRILLANHRADQLLSASASDQPGRRHAVETNNLFFSAFRTKAVLGAHRGEQSELVMVDPVDGSDVLLEVLLLPLHGKLGGDDGEVYVLRDITELKRVSLELETQYNRSLTMEHQARRESERLNVIIENAGAPILVTDPHARIILMNREAERVFGSLSSPWPAPATAADVRANSTKITGLINDFLLQQRMRREEQVILVDPESGDEFPLEVVSTKILSRQGEPTAVVCVLHDLTDQVENERLARELVALNAELGERVEEATRELATRNDLLETQRAELERASRMKSEFVTTISHELRTPINALLGYSSLLQEGIFGEISDGQSAALDRMRASAEHLLKLINDILDLSTVEAGKLRLNVERIELAPFIRDVSETARSIVARKSLAFEVEIADGLPDVHTDVTRLRQVLLNLLGNAVKFTDVGHVLLRVVGDGDDHVLIEVEDTGIGIGEDDIDAIFEEFRQADQSVTRSFGGTGLGLAISRKLLTLMGGSVSIESQLGEGSTFRVRLPIAATAARAATT